MKMDNPSLIFIQYCITVGLLCIILFLQGFFPIKSSSNIFSTQNDFPTTLDDIVFHKEKLYNTSVGKTILMVIDGIRVDFVTADLMPYTSAVMGNGQGEGCQLTARVAAPTVTLPRVKAIVTGTVSSFVDVVLNFGTQELILDNIIHQAIEQTKRVVFYGDDTWIKLFPHHFLRHDGTTSFYVNDYTEVDVNVTRHLDSELEQSDWDLMILHYLGLDHIGHIEGPKSLLVGPKLREMDNIIARLHAYLKTQGGLLLVCGDHGMKDSGSHGGVSTPEVLVPVMVFGLTCPDNFKEEISQVDLAPTLSALWGAPIPADSVGVAAMGLMSHLSHAQRSYTQLYNAQQLAHNFLRNGGSPQHESYLKYEEAAQLHYEWLKADNMSSSVTHPQMSALYQSSIIGMSRYLTAVLTKYNMIALLSAIVVALQLVCLLVLRVSGVFPLSGPSLYSVCSLGVVVFLTVLLIYLEGLTSISTIVIFTFALIFSYNTLYLLLQLKSASSFNLKVSVVTSSREILLLPGTVLSTLSLFSSSLIEEEHQVWYWLWSSVCALRLRYSPRSWLAVLVMHRALRTLNATGDQWAHLPDLSDWLLKPHNKTVLSLCCLLSLGWVCSCCSRVTSSRLGLALCIGTAVCIFQHKAAVHQVTSIFPTWSLSGVPVARLSWLLLALVALHGRSAGSLILSWMLASCLLLRAHNVVLVPALLTASRVITHSTPTNTLANTVLHHWLGCVFYFCQGNSNSLASVDVAAGYVGLEEYNVAVVTVLLLIHTYSMPVLAFLLNLHHTLSNSRMAVTASLELTVVLQILHMTACLLGITIQRYHLFVWTVFSPKLLYVSVQMSLYFIIISVTNICIFCTHKNNKL